MSDSKWHKFGEKGTPSYEELVDVGRALMGLAPREHAWVRLNKDHTAYQLGPRTEPRQ
jgi:hypothetical protein